jgi:flavin-dependent dehydrogenase
MDYPASAHRSTDRPGDYPHRFNSFDHFVVHLLGFTIKSNSVQHSIRRFEFDDWLLKRSGVPVIRHKVRQIVKQDGEYILDGQYRAKYLIGAGGTKCPVYRDLFRDANPRARELQVVTLEHEFPFEYADSRCHVWFFINKLPGYSWYMPKANGYINIGIGAMAKRLKDRGDDIWRHWELFLKELGKRQLVKQFNAQPKGYSYYLRDDVNTVRIDNAFITGDAVGLATRDLAEGIGPAVRSGLLAADAITEGCEYSIANIERYSDPKDLASRLLAYFMVKYTSKASARSAVNTL